MCIPRKILTIVEIGNTAVEGYGILQTGLTLYRSELVLQHLRVPRREMVTGQAKRIQSEMNIYAGYAVYKKS